VPLQLITPPDDEPVTLDEAKQQLGLDLPTWDDKVELLVGAARRYLENNLRRGLVTQTWEVVESHFPFSSACWASASLVFPRCEHHRCRPGDRFPSLELKKGNISSVTSVKYIDLAGVEQTLDPSVYSLDKASVPGRLHLAYGQSWPDVRPQWDAVKVRYVVGWGQADVPLDLKQALLLLVSQMHQNDVPEVTGTIISSVRFSYEALAGPYRIMSV
jgi:hypothetical protein